VQVCTANPLADPPKSYTSEHLYTTSTACIRPVPLAHLYAHVLLPLGLLPLHVQEHIAPLKQVACVRQHMGLQQQQQQQQHGTHIEERLVEHRLHIPCLRGWWNRTNQHRSAVHVPCAHVLFPAPASPVTTGLAALSPQVLQRVTCVQAHGWTPLGLLPRVMLLPAMPVCKHVRACACLRSASVFLLWPGPDCEPIEQLNL